MIHLSGVLERLLDYWQNLPREDGSKVPSRAALVPEALHEILPKITLLKRLDHENMLMSVLGTGSRAIATSPMVGINAYDLTSPRMLEFTAKLYDCVLDQPSGALIRETVERRAGKTDDIASLYLPLTGEDGEASYIMGCSVFDNRFQSDCIKRQALGHNVIRKVDFIDIGNGAPVWKFPRPATQPNLSQSMTRWWDRLIPSKPKVSSQIRLDS